MNFLKSDIKLSTKETTGLITAFVSKYSVITNNMEKSIKRLLDAKSAAEYLSISRSKLYQWVDAGKIPSVRIDSRRLFDILELNEFVEQLKREQRN
ncbi:helix-turn-helix domain-containing protein [candidate division KSB1 bacterium]|nr:helix-turn-helix domain-containing protein [candidate division KSB1 bacterium]